MWVHVDKVFSRWICPKCSNIIVWTFEDVSAYEWSPGCDHCNTDMELQDLVEVDPT